MSLNISLNLKIRTQVQNIEICYISYIEICNACYYFDNIVANVRNLTDTYFE